VHTTQVLEDTHVTLTLVNPDGQQQSSSVSSQFVTSMFNPSPDAGTDSLFESTPRVDVPVTTTVVPLLVTALTLPPPFIPIMLRDEAQAENEDFINKLDENIQKIIKEQVKTSYVVAADLSKLELKKILIEKIKSNKRRDDANKNKEPFVGSDRGSKRRREGKEPESTSALKEKASKTTDNDLAKQADSCASFNEMMDTPVDFLLFLINQLKVDTLNLELLAGPTYELMKGSCKSLVELEFFLEEVYKATTDQLDWNNPEGQQYPHNLLKPLLLIPNFRGRCVIPFHHFINNDIEYLRGGASSSKYTTFVTKTNAADYGHIKWIEDLILEWHNYKHLDWITVGRDDDKLYKFKEGDLKRLCFQDIKDMLLLLVQEKLTNLTVEERFAFNVSLRMFTRSIVIQRRTEDLQLGVESYQKKLNLTRPDKYKSNLKRKEAYTAYSNLRGFIYQNKDKQNRLMRIDELHKFSDDTLNDVRTALDDRLKGIQMKYLP
nr:hypothetical protein [Tanacetum cinerariifolium]